jgi:phospholipid transport system substrate-binding protein
MKKYFLVPLVLFLSIFLISAPSFSASDPVSMVESIANQMLAQLKANKATLKTHPTQVYSMANRIIVPHADLDAMSQRVLPPEVWRQATASQRAEFKREFTTVLVRTYASALASYTNETIRFFPVRGGYQGKSSVVVNSQIMRSDGPAINVSYRMISSGSGWQLLDMTVEGVSMLQSFRSQFGDKLASGNMGALIVALKQHNSSNARR